MSHTPNDEHWLKYELTVTDEENDEVLYTDWSYSIEDLEEKLYKLDKVKREHEEKIAKEDKQKELEAEFDKKYANGDFDGERGTGKDDLPDFKDNWVAERL